MSTCSKGMDLRHGRWGRTRDPIMARHIRKGDMVVVRTGSSRKGSHRMGRVLRVMPDGQRVIVEGVNVCKKHVKPTQQNQQGGLVEKELPIHISNVSPAVDGKPTRVRFETRPDGSKVRLAVSGGEVIGQPLKKAKN